MNVRSVIVKMEDMSEKKKAIFESTLDLIKDHGFHGTPMSMVAKSAGVAAGTIYHYFESKDQLICELYTYNIQRVQELILETIATDQPYKEKFYNVWINLYKFYIKNPKVLIFFEQYLNSPYNKNKSPGHQGPLSKFFELGMKNGTIKNVKTEILFLLVIGSVNSTAKLKSVRHTHLEESDLTQIINILWEGISKK